jgi:hypothetical protein
MSNDHVSKPFHTIIEHLIPDPSWEVEVTQVPGYNATIRELKDSGTRETIETGAMKEPSNGRGDFSLLPFEVIWDDAIHYEQGAKKYAPRNFEKGIPFSKCFSSAIRHMIQFWMGDKSENHLAAARWHMAALSFYLKRIDDGTIPASLDDRPKYGEKK